MSLGERVSVAAGVLALVVLAASVGCWRYQECRAVGFSVLYCATSR